MAEATAGNSRMERQGGHPTLPQTSPQGGPHTALAGDAPPHAPPPSHPPSQLHGLRSATASRSLVPGPYRTDYRYIDRPTKAVYISKKYATILRGSVLDVGCDAAALRHLVARQDEYVGIDMRSDADIVLNLDEDTRPDGTILPFPDRSFDTVVCTDVLEHLDRCHAVFDELCRVAKDRVIVSLPNPLANMIDALRRGTDGRLKYYGLPVDPPADRHRWFFGFEEGAEFMRGRGARNGFAVEQLDAETAQNHYWYVEPDFRDVLDSTNARLGTSWCVLRRRG